jgi:hypothetical protein
VKHVFFPISHYFACALIIAKQSVLEWQSAAESGNISEAQTTHLLLVPNGFQFSSAAGRRSASLIDKRNSDHVPT